VHRFTQLLCCKFFISVVLDNSIFISVFILVVVAQINRTWRKATDSLSLAAISGERRCRATDSPASMVTDGKQRRDGYVRPLSGSDERRKK
jgi:hypothetical protein